MTAREAAYSALIRIEKSGKYTNLELSAMITKQAFSQKEKALFTILLYGVTERLLTLDYIIGRLTDGKSITKEVKCILRVGLYQILYLEKIPPSAACNESVNICKKYIGNKASGLVNAVMRRAAREKDYILHLFDCPESTVDLSVKYSLPEWLCEMWIADFGKDKAISLMEHTFSRKPISLRVNTLKNSTEELVKALADLGIESQKSELSDTAVNLKSNVPISDILPLEEGRCFVQDEASQLCVSALSARPGETVIDCCACPGGKSFGAAIDMGNTGNLLSFDLHASKLSLIRSGAEKLGIDIIKTDAKNASIFDESLSEYADRVICDVPCSGLGVISKKPDIRYKDASEIERLPEIQYAILSNVSRYLKPGGTLIYSTCTLNKRENQDITDRFISENADFEYSEKGKVTLFPDTNGTDGFYIASIVKK